MAVTATKNKTKSKATPTKRRKTIKKEVASNNEKSVITICSPERRKFIIEHFSKIWYL